MADRLQLPVGTHTVSALLSTAPDAKALAVIAHGAGAGMEHPFMVGASEGLAANGVSVLRFNFVYAEEGRRSPDRPALLTEAWAVALETGLARAGGVPVVAGGKSMGGRIASQAVAQGLRAEGLVFLGYPLHPPGRFDALRDRHLAAITAPMLFVQGTRDAFARADLLAAVLGGLGDRARLHSVEGGDHSFGVPRRTGRTPAQVEAEMAAAIVAWLTARDL
jgi:uncharacterized protein